MAKRAALARWYRIDGSPTERIDCCLRFLAKMAAHFELEGDIAAAARTVTAMWKFERMKIALQLRTQAMNNVTPASQPSETKSDEQIVTQFGDASRSPKKTNLLN